MQLSILSTSSYSYVLQFLPVFCRDFAVPKLGMPRLDERFEEQNHGV